LICFPLVDQSIIPFTLQLTKPTALSTIHSDIQVSYSQRDLERNVRRKYTRTVVASVAEKSIPLILNGPSIDTGDAIAQLGSPSGQLSVTLRSVAGEKKKHFVEVT
jgi:acylaminoacyl-peptidase